MSNTMIFTKDIIMKLKEVREEKGLSLNDILTMIEDNGEFVSKTTLSRVFAEGSEEIKFRYEDTIRPIANALLDVETIEDTDDTDVQGLKSYLIYKKKVIEVLEAENIELKATLDKEKLKYHDRLDKERQQYEKELKQHLNTIEILREQLAYKDKRMDEFMDTLKVKDTQMAGMLDHIMNCPFRKGKQ